MGLFLNSQVINFCRKSLWKAFPFVGRVGILQTQDYVQTQLDIKICFRVDLSLGGEGREERDKTVCD